MSDASSEEGHGTVEYVMHYRMVGPGYREDDRREKVLHVLHDGSHHTPARTDDEAASAVSEFVNRPFINVAVEVARVTKVTTTRAYEDVTAIVAPGREGRS